METLGEILLNKMPWYLRNKCLMIICFITPPIGYIIIVTNKKKLSREKWLEYLTVSTVMASIWMLKFLPDLLQLSILVGIFVVYLAYKVLKGRK